MLKPKASLQDSRVISLGTTFKVWGLLKTNQACLNHLKNTNNEGFLQDINNPDLMLVLRLPCGCRHIWEPPSSPNKSQESQTLDQEVIILKKVLNNHRKWKCIFPLVQWVQDASEVGGSHYFSQPALKNHCTYPRCNCWAHTLITTMQSPVTPQCKVFPYL